MPRDDTRIRNRILFKIFEFPARIVPESSELARSSCDRRPYRVHVFVERVDGGACLGADSPVNLPPPRASGMKAGGGGEESNQ